MYWPNECENAPIRIPGATTTGTSEFWPFAEVFETAMIVPDRKSYAGLLEVDVIGAGSKAVPNASDSVR